MIWEHAEQTVWKVIHRRNKGFVVSRLFQLAGGKFNPVDIHFALFLVFPLSLVDSPPDELALRWGSEKDFFAGPIS